MKILITPDKALRTVAKPLEQWDKKTFDEVSEMARILREARDPEGVGLAATQVGINKRFFILLDNDQIKVFVNPEIIEASEKMLSSVYKKSSKRWLEGCLSIPKIWGFVDRPYTIKIRYQTPETFNPNGKLITIEKTLEDMESSYFQHERDHLDGILFTDHILRQNGQLFRENNGKLHEFSLVS